MNFLCVCKETKATACGRFRTGCKSQGRDFSFMGALIHIPRGRQFFMGRRGGRDWITKVSNFCCLNNFSLLISWSVYLSIHVYLFIYISVFLSTYLSIRPSIYLPIYFISFYLFYLEMLQSHSDSPVSNPSVFLVNSSEIKSNLQIFCN